MAQQLRRQGEEVALLALLDTYAPGYERLLPNASSWRYKLFRVAQRFDLEIKNLLVLTPKAQAAYIFWRGKRFVRWLARRAQNMMSELYERMRYPLPDAFRETQKALRQASQRYTPRNYTGRVTLFRASKQPAGWKDDPVLGWQPLISGQIEAFEIPGYHDSIATGPRAGVLGEKLRECLIRAHAEAATKSSPSVGS
jgi:thioesterase domain-containing protein